MTTDAVTPAAYTSAASVIGWTSTTEIDQLAPAFVAALGELADVPRRRKADAVKFEYRYADLGDVLAVSRPILAAHGLAAFQVPVVSAGAVEVTTTVLHVSGQWLRFYPLRLPAGDTAQAIGSAITYRARYSATAALNMATLDDDGAAASQTSPVLMPQAWLDRFRDRTFPLDHDEIAAVVRAATGGRTDDPELVWLDEAKALGQALSVALGEDVGEDVAAASAGMTDAAATADEDSERSYV